MSYYNVVLLLGSNINNPEDNITVALKKIEEQAGAILKKSELIQSEPVEFVSNNNFCNIAVQIKTQFSPVVLLKRLKKIEVEMGRILDSTHYEGYQDRIIDIDIILFNDIRFVSKKLVIPHHKNLYERRFARNIIAEVRLSN